MSRAIQTNETGMMMVLQAFILFLITAVTVMYCLQGFSPVTEDINGMVQGVDESNRFMTDDMKERQDFILSKGWVITFVSSVVVAGIYIVVVVFREQGYTHQQEDYGVWRR